MLAARSYASDTPSMFAFKSPAWVGAHMRCKDRGARRGDEDGGCCVAGEAEAIERGAGLRVLPARIHEPGGDGRVSVKTMHQGVLRGLGIERRSELSAAPAKGRGKVSAATGQNSVPRLAADARFIPSAEAQQRNVDRQNSVGAPLHSTGGRRCEAKAEGTTRSRVGCARARRKKSS